MTTDQVVLQARHYASDLLGDRRVVRLVPDNLQEVEDLTLETFGLRPDGAVPVGEVPNRAVGFPARAIITDPGNARHALNLVQGLQRAVRQAKSKPGNARDEILVMAAQLGRSAPHFLPTFLEEAARHFVEAENPRLATQFFTKAREAERVHGLPIDQDHHRAVLLEFALAGALSAKELVAALSHLEPADALDSYRQLTIDRARGGLPPSATTATDLRRLIKAAGAAADDVEPDFLAALAREAATRRAPVGFWKGFGRTLTRLAKADPALRDTLFRTNPTGGDVEGWLTVLDSTGVLDGLRRGERDAADWATRMLGSLTYHSAYPRTLALLLRTLPGLRGADVRLAGQGSPQPELVDALLEVGARVELPAHLSLGLDHWVKAPERADLEFLAADEALAARVNLDWLLRTEVPPALLQHSGSRELLRRWAHPRLGSEPTAMAVWEEFQRLRPLMVMPDRRVVADGLRAFAKHIDGPELLAGALRHGLLTELGWPALEAAADDLRRDTGKAPTFHEAWPAIGVAAAGEVRFVDGDRVVASARFAPQGAREPEKWRYTLVDGVVGCLWGGSGWKNNLTWASDPARHHEQEPTYLGFQSPAASIEVGGARLCGRAVQRVGDAKQVFLNPSMTLSDGTTYWTLDDTGQVAEIDPATGRRGRQSLPAELARIAEPHLREGHHLSFGPTTWRPTTPTTAGSLLPTADGVHGWIVLRGPHRHIRALEASGAVLELDGATHDNPIGRLTRPGGGAWVVTPDGGLRTADGAAPIGRALDEHGRHHFLHDVHGSGWHQFGVRDEAASRRMRSVTARDVGPLLRASHTSASFGQVDPEKHGDERLTRAALAAAGKLLGTRDQTLLASVAWLAAKVKFLVAAVEATLDVPKSAPAGTFTEWAPRLDVVNWLPHAHWGQQVTRDDILAFAAGARGSGTRSYGLEVLPEVAARPDVLLALAAAPLQDSDAIRGAAALFGTLKDSGLATNRTMITWFQTSPRNLGNHDPGTVLPHGRHRGIVARVDHRTAAHFVIWPSGDYPTRAAGAEQVLFLGARPTMDLGQFVKAFEHLLRHGGPRWNPEWADRLAAGTGWSRAAAALFLAGMQGVRSWQKNFLTKELRELLGLKLAEATAGREYLRTVDFRLLFDMYTMGAIDPMRLVTEGPDVDAMVSIWRERAPQEMSLPGELLAAADKAVRYGGARMLQGVVDGGGEIHASASMLFWLAAQLPLDDPMRGWVADRFEAFTERARAHTWQLDWRPATDRSLASISPAIKVTPHRDYDIWTLDPALVTDWHRLLAQLDVAGRPLEGLQRLRRAVPLLSGDVAPLLAWLRRPGTGWGQDPLVSAPATVAAVRAELGLDEGPARYWLQLLALHAPTDADVDRWNGWSARDRERAAAPLVAQGLVVKAKRARARRAHFLPGGWLEAAAPHLPMEVWKAPLYALRDAPRVEPVHEAVVAEVPPGELFEAAWERFAAGDRPGYEELRTQPYRRRRG